MQGPQGPAGKVELVTCKTVIKTVKKKVRGKTRKVTVTQQVCTTRLVSGTVKFTTTGASYGATVSRGRVIYASGTGVATGSGRWHLVLGDVRPIRAGHYTLTLQGRRGRRSITQRVQITIA